MEVKKLVIPFDVKADGEEEGNSPGYFEGYGAIFGNVDLGGDLIEKGAFKATLREWKKAKQMPGMYWFHNLYDPIGEWLSMEEDDKGLYAKGNLWVEGNSLGRTPIPKAEQTRNVITGNGPKGLSIGYGLVKWRYEKVDGEPVRILSKLQLMELSPVPFAMNPKAVITESKCHLVSENGELASVREFEKTLRDAGLSNKQAKKFISGGYKSLLHQDDHCDDELSELISAIKEISFS